MNFHCLLHNYDLSQNSNWKQLDVPNPHETIQTGTTHNLKIGIKIISHLKV